MKTLHGKLIDMKDVLDKMAQILPSPASLETQRGADEGVE